MADDYPLTLHQIDGARGDIYALSEEIEVLARLPTRRELARIALGVIFGTAGLVIEWFELFWRHCL